MTQNLAPTTVARRLGFARTFFHAALKHKVIDENPFANTKIPTADPTVRQRFVDRATVERLLAVANPTWRTIIALTRFGGLRCPSEVLSLEWVHIDWKTGRMKVPSPKTDRYAGKDNRIVPLFEDLRPYLEEARRLAAPGQTHVVGGDYLAKARGPKGWRNCNLRTTLCKLLKKAGLTAWPKIAHNLRSSRETELLEDFPVQTVARWMGHDPKVCLKHYAQTTDEHFERAIGGANSGVAKTQKAAQQVAAASGKRIGKSTNYLRKMRLVPRHVSNWG